MHLGMLKCWVTEHAHFKDMQLQTSIFRPPSLASIACCLNKNTLPI